MQYDTAAIVKPQSRAQGTREIRSLISRYMYMLKNSSQISPDTKDHSTLQKNRELLLLVSSSLASALASVLASNAEQKNVQYVSVLL